MIEPNREEARRSAMNVCARLFPKLECTHNIDIIEEAILRAEKQGIKAGYEKGRSETRRPQQRRYTARDKARILFDIDGGKIARADAMREHNLSEEELLSWRTAYAFNGLNGLKQLEIQKNNGRNICTR